MKKERWVFTDAEIDNGGNGCRRNDLFLASVSGCEERVVMMRNGQATNQYEDGSVGVLAEDRNEAEQQEKYHTQDGTVAQVWRNVLVDDHGGLHKIIEE